MAPGFILRTAEAWESLIALAARASLPDRSVGKPSYHWAQRYSLVKKTEEPLTLTPDLTISMNGGISLLVDSKYKGRLLDPSKEKIQISSADVYESIAYLEATGASNIVLVYPGRIDTSLGVTLLMEKVILDEKSIVSIAIDPRGIAIRGGFRRFADGLGAALRAHEVIQKR